MNTRQERLKAIADKKDLKEDRRQRVILFKKKVVKTLLAEFNYVGSK